MEDIDPDIQAGFDRLENAAREAEAKAAGSATPPTSDAAPQASSAWKEEAALLVTMFRSYAANWTISDEHHAMLADALAAIGDKYMPGGFDALAQWGPWAKLAAAGGMIALANFDFATFRLQPLRVSEAATAAQQGEPVRPTVATDAPSPPVTSTKRRRAAKKKGKGTDAK